MATADVTIQPINQPWFVVHKFWAVISLIGRYAVSLKLFVQVNESLTVKERFWLIMHDSTLVW